MRTQLAAWADAVCATAPTPAVTLRDCCVATRIDQVRPVVAASCLVTQDLLGALQRRSEVGLLEILGSLVIGTNPKQTKANIIVVESCRMRFDEMFGLGKK